MENYKIPKLTSFELNEGIEFAKISPRRRFPKILHSPGDEFNQVFNFMMSDSYMQPHLHPGVEKIEKIYIIEGKIITIFFDDFGAIKQCIMLEKGSQEMVSVPAYTWHTYIILTSHAITYETMMGKYDPSTWKNFFTIAPAEDSIEHPGYLLMLKDKALKLIQEKK
jgi:cupin fold WbuC family metalloprotein